MQGAQTNLFGPDIENAKNSKLDQDLVKTLNICSTLSILNHNRSLTFWRKAEDIADKNLNEDYDLNAWFKDCLSGLEDRKSVV